MNQVGETLAGPRTSEAFSLRGGVDALLDPGNHFGDEEKPRRLRAVQGLTLDCETQIQHKSLRQEAFNSNIFKPVPFACLDAECLRAKSVGCGVVERLGCTVLRLFAGRLRKKRSKLVLAGITSPWSWSKHKEMCEDIRRYMYEFINGMWHKDSARICALVSWTWTEDQTVHFPDPGVPRAVQIDDPAEALEALMAVSGGKF